MEPAPERYRQRHSTRHRLGRVLESARWLGALSAVTSLLLCATAFVWALVKAVLFIAAIGTGTSEEALVLLFESIDTILVGTVLLQVGLGMWELCISDLDLPPALTTASFDVLKSKVAATLVLVLAVRFLEELVRRPPGEQLLSYAAAIVAVGALLIVFSRWRWP